jgi:hypothetical protein
MKTCAKLMVKKACGNSTTPIKDSEGTYTVFKLSN